ncbi:putative tricarboxylic transport membrane protein [Stella humosa]|uniref:Putative tricarboxylic transport membrane protein n=1 Tax=Stella humosa TaxID=94 RepID=A0A3N1LNC2_9PROT|nr:tripartite tricarboxylate transporter permease [Stella humosa]ROP90715.1 putative tricarboxylic transport membrane protein [Stella humosa]BBK29385.1 C4-dicarboxylate ABC transporter permease [Stella humosa]
MFELLGDGLLNVLQLKYFVPLAIGTLVGVVGGALPGITITMTVIMVLPFTFGLEPLQGLAAMIGVYVGGESGGLITATLIGIPGKPSSISTTFDGFPMTRKGEPGRAVWLGIWASFFGGLLGGVFLIGATGWLADIALQFGPWEFFALFIFALSMVAGLTEESLAKGLLAGALGLIITTFGSDPIMSVPRFTMGSQFLVGGFPFLPVLIGIFAFAQLMTDIERARSLAVGDASAKQMISLAVSQTRVVGEILSRPFLLLWSTFIGILIGVLPAIGGSAASVMAYDQAKKLSRHPERFGTGTPEGIIASEASNNANVGGSLVTIMAFGIPGDAVTAVMLGAMTIHGIQSGPLFMSQETTLAYGIFAAYLLAHPIMLAIMAIGARWFLLIVTIPKSVLIPVVLVLCVVGAYALNNTIDSVWVLALFGLVGYGLVKLGFPLAPLILGLILGDQIEVNLVRALMTDSDLWLFVTRPISALLLALSVLSVAIALWQRRRPARGATEPDVDF